MGLKKQYGAWVVVGDPVVMGKSYSPYVKCECKCGEKRFVLVKNLQCGASTNCGCQRKPRRVAH